MLILISELNQSPWWIEHTRQQSSSINIDHWLQEILRLYDIWPSIIYNLCNIIILLLFCLFRCTTIQCHLGTQWDESKGSLEGFRHLGKWHLQVTSRDSDFPKSHSKARSLWIWWDIIRWSARHLSDNAGKTKAKTQQPVLSLWFRYIPKWMHF